MTSAATPEGNAAPVARAQRKETPHARQKKADERKNGPLPAAAPVARPTGPQIGVVPVFVVCAVVEQRLCTAAAFLEAVFKAVGPVSTCAASVAFRQVVFTAVGAS